MHCLPLKLTIRDGSVARKFGGQPKLYCIQCGRYLAPGAFPVLRQDGRTLFLSDRCRECDSAASGDGAIDVALHILWRSSWTIAKNKGRSPEFTLRFEEVKRLWVSQRGLCTLTGRPMNCSAKLDRVRDLLAPSIDRIDSNGPYAVGNVHLVCWAVNRMKNTMSVAELVDWCSAVAANATAAADSQAA